MNYAADKGLAAQGYERQATEQGRNVHQVHHDRSFPGEVFLVWVRVEGFGLNLYLIRYEHSPISEPTLKILINSFSIAGSFEITFNM